MFHRNSVSVFWLDVGMYWLSLRLWFIHQLYHVPWSRLKWRKKYMFRVLYINCVMYLDLVFHVETTCFGFFHTSIVSCIFILSSMTKQHFSGYFIHQFMYFDLVFHDEKNTCFEFFCCLIRYHIAKKWMNEILMHEERNWQ